VLWLLLACGPSTDALAVAACEGVPGLSMDGAGQALFADLVTPDVLAHWRNTPPHAGLAHLGPIAYGVVRANVRCEAVSSRSDQVELVRHEPELVWPFDKEAVEDLPTRPVSVVLDVVETGDGRRVSLDLERASSELDAAHQASVPEALAALDALSGWFPDPMIRWERRLVEERAVLARLDGAARLDTELGTVHMDYTLDDDVEQLTLEVRCGERSDTLDVPNVGPGSELVLLSPIEVDASCTASVVSVTLPR